ncbi:Lrp/AsnC family transcriptional regulator [Roseovarius pelagicus]|uniref:Lrp/AsnC family transcriptional regulator n=1 Tax=Roseovarius pelagicus TaxID=2980108 RepID=A0ABY6DBL9_9RHOB|nr:MULTISPECIES: Lrp/AsnC family transcriptional regulator [Rhodobacterales]UXX82578.1 Lrp/AsnC family transcriptional regulator [Roseovarius pelagicus]
MKQLDQTDIRILRTLQKEGNIPNTRLSEIVALSTSQCWQRVQRLQRDGYIMGYNAVINHELLGYSDIVLVEIAAARDEVSRIAQLCDELSKIPEVLEVHLTSGEFDCFIKVAVDGTRGYENFLNQKLYRIKGIRNSRSSFSLKCFKSETGFVPDTL